MLKIIHITNDLQRLGGVQRHLVSLQKDEFSFEIIITRGENEYIQEFASIGVEVFHLRDLGLTGVIKHLNNADVVHAHLFPSIYIAMLTTTPTLITEHNPHYRRRDYPFVKLIESFLFKKFIRILCISQGVRVSFLSAIKVNPAMTQIVPNGIDLARFTLVPKPYPKNNKLFKLGMVGRLVAQKDIVTLIKLMPYLDNNFELHLAGDGCLRESFELLSNRLNLHHRVIFHGQVNDVNKFLLSLDVYIQSSFEEGFGLAVVEAMASGLPCLASNVNGLNGVIDFEYLFEVGDIQCLVGKINDFRNSVQLYDRAARYSVVQARKFSIEKSAQIHSSIYKDICM
ncbi:MAG: glycosyltransferase [Legionellales bacterium]|nr:glycosyltransferase [Legionellales bacterium]